MLEKISETLKKIIDGVSDPYNREFKVSEDRTELLEEEIGRMKEIFSGERLPILPGDSRVAAEIDVTRAVARRAERELALVSVKFGSDTGAGCQIIFMCWQGMWMLRRSKRRRQIFLEVFRNL